MSGSTKYALVRKSRDNLFVVDATYQNCTTKWLELYLRRYISHYFKEFSIFVVIIRNVFMWKKSDIFIKLHRACFSTDTFFFGVSYTSKHALPEVIEIIPAYDKCGGSWYSHLGNSLHTWRESAQWSFADWNM